MQADVDRNLFENLAANIKQYGRGVTLYCSSYDRAMAAARRMAGGIPRAGDVPSDGPIVLAGIDTIDISQTSTDYLALNHSSYAEKSALLAELGHEASETLLSDESPIALKLLSALTDGLVDALRNADRQLMRLEAERDLDGAPRAWMESVSHQTTLI